MMTASEEGQLRFVSKMNWRMKYVVSIIVTSRFTNRVSVFRFYWFPVLELLRNGLSQEED